MAGNPYEILGISQNASEDEIKTAYRNLARQYHSDGSPSHEDARKMQELDSAYDAVMANLRGAGNAYQSYNGSSEGYTQSGYSDVRSRIGAGRLDDAETILNGIPKDIRNAEWYFLKGQIHQKRGWLDEAYKNYSVACKMEPTNTEYANAFKAFQNGASGGYRTSRKAERSGCDICQGLLCADCCCECFGGDLVPCC